MFQFQQMQDAHDRHRAESEKKALEMCKDFDEKIALIAEKQTISHKHRKLIRLFRERLLQSHVKSLYLYEHKYVVFIGALVEDLKIPELTSTADEDDFIAFMMDLDGWQYAVDKVREELEELAQSLADREQARREEGDTSDEE